MLHIAEGDKFVLAGAQEAIADGLAYVRLARAEIYPGVDHAFARVGGHSYDARAATIANGRTAELLVKMLG
jgi:carboxymethylenebutenolidase